MTRMPRMLCLSMATALALAACAPREEVAAPAPVAVTPAPAPVTPVIADAAKLSAAGLGSTTLMSSSADCWQEPWSEGPLTGDMINSQGVPMGHGHVYGWHQAAAWAQIMPPDGWTAADTRRLTTTLAATG